MFCCLLLDRYSVYDGSNISIIGTKVSIMLPGKGLSLFFLYFSLTVLSNRGHIASRMGQDMSETITRT